VKAWTFSEREHQMQECPTVDPGFLRTFSKSSGSLELLDGFNNAATVSQNVSDNNVGARSCDRCRTRPQHTASGIHRFRVLAGSFE